MGFSFGGITKGFSDLVNGTKQAVSLAGQYYGIKDGKWTNQVGIVHAGDEWLGGVTGRNEQRHALNVAGDQANAAVQQQRLLLKQQQTQAMQADQAASTSAAGIQATAQARGSQAFSPTATPQTYGSKLGSDTTNFLGI